MLADFKSLVSISPCFELWHNIKSRGRRVSITERCFSNVHMILRKVDKTCVWVSELNAFALEYFIFLQSLNLGLNKIALIGGDAFSNTAALKILVISGNLLTSLPTLSDICDTLEELNLKNNKIEMIPDNSFSSCSKLVRLDISQNLVTVINEMKLTGLTSIDYLTLHENKLEDVVGNFIWNHPILKNLFLGRNSLTQLPSLVTNGASQLTNLSLTENQITQISPNQVNHLERLVFLDISKNLLTDISFVLVLPSLVRTNFNNNPILFNETLMDKVPNLLTFSLVGAGALKFPLLSASKSTLSEIKVPRNEISCIDVQHLANMTNLETLEIFVNKIEKIPDFGCSGGSNSDVSMDNWTFPSLTTFSAQDNNLIEFPLLPGIVKGASLFLDNNYISIFPPERMKLLEHVVKLTLQNNKADHFPDFSQLPMTNVMRSLTLEHNQIINISLDNIRTLHVLAGLNLRNNQIENLPNLTFLTPTLNGLQLKNNHIRDISGLLPYSGSAWLFSSFDVSSNQLIDIPRDILEKMPKLKFLLASYNVIEDMPFLTVVGTHLIEARLDHNNISLIEEGHISGSSRLEKLYLSYNYIAYLNLHILRDLTRLKLLDLRYNKLVTPSILTGTSLASSLVIQLTNNPYECEESLCMMKREPLLIDGLLCSTPVRYAGQTVQSALDGTNCCEYYIITSKYDTID